MQQIKVSVDAVVFGYFEKSSLHLLLIRRNIEPFKNQWAIPGGLVQEDEDIDTAALRELEEEAGIRPGYLEQLYTFGQVQRDPRGRVVSVAYYGLVNPSYHKLKADTDAADARWFSIDKLPILAFDHQHIVEQALNRLRSKIKYAPVGFNLLHDEFSFSDLEDLYQTIIGQPIDRRNFRKKILSFGLLEQTPRFRKEGSGRPGRLYTFNQQKYQELTDKGFFFEI
ncbi:NUDIX hydrolase [Arachidicoccus terrestris]|uniref:NUDIX hydrolase n=1 Tax=Arachidicoccus terrestris TaxID=2875539 RepID=UPI001CC59AA9|nr:NUDIX domain-containing protein [Arachidicoccus terrestris]UAY56975.1 NUDIX hydrolase [Arachidicoccus terrestris]